MEAAAGAWEIVQGADVELVAAGHYRLTRLLRGQRGSEWAMGDPAPSGARVVLLDTRLMELPISRSEIGSGYTWRVGPASNPYTHISYVEAAFTPRGEGLQCFAPTGLRLSADAASGDLTLSWIRRDRDPAADSWVVDTPLSEASEAYDLEILSLDGLTVLRTITDLGAPSYTYSAASQIADFGGSVTTIRARIYQLGALGRGHPAEETLAVSEAS